MLDEVPAILFCMDSALRITFISRAYTEKTGVAAASLVGRELYELLVPEDRAQARDAFTEALLNLAPSYASRVRLQCAGDDFLWVDLLLVLRMSSGQLGVSSIGIIREAQSTMKLELLVARLQRELTSANLQVEQLLSESQESLVEAGVAFNNQLQAPAVDTPYYSIYVISRPSLFLGGDVFFYREPAPATLLVGLADAMGHGPAASLRAVGVKAAALSYLRLDPDPMVLLTRLNEHAADYLDEGAYFTLILAEVDFAERRIRVFNCGGPPVLYYGRQMVTLHANNAPIGLYSQARFNCHQVAFRPSASMLFLSDGWLEPEDLGGQTVQISPVQAFAGLDPSVPVTELALKQAVQAVQPVGRFVDDLSAMQIVLKQR